MVLSRFYAKSCADLTKALWILFSELFWIERRFHQLVMRLIVQIVVTFSCMSLLMESGPHLVEDLLNFSGYQLPTALALIFVPLHCAIRTHTHRICFWIALRIICFVLYQLMTYFAFQIYFMNCLTPVCFDATLLGPAQTTITNNIEHCLTPKATWPKAIPQIGDPSHEPYIGWEIWPNSVTIRIATSWNGARVMIFIEGCQICAHH